MILEPEDAPSIGSYALEDSISIEESVIEDLNRSLFRRNKLSVKIN